MEYNDNIEATNRKFLEAIGDLNEAFQDERSDLVYYQYLAGMAPTAKERDIIYSIIQEERVNATLLRRMYEELSGIDVSYDTKEKLIMPKSYIEGISEAINRETREVERYKAIREGFPVGSSYIYTLSNIIENELSHIRQLNSILSSNNNINTQNINSYNSVNNTVTNTSINEPINNSSKIENLVKQHTANFTLDDWSRFIRPLVSRVLSEDGDRNTVQFFRKLILSGILIGLGNRPLAAIELVERWQQNGTPDLPRMNKMITCNTDDILF
ncbi:ferritin-like domain-containing protein [Clostridium beijerinckii]|uniref:Rubrerythrin n=1 Tax=Clostridium beijerinckii TaxID=1520 RepID=A0A1S9N4X1_CLOBE|nr:ferritin-like domain-containing protein [Clostridium beijerinckii]MZK51089.1 ferritin-like domain-containing protein [Clostridium beijerinckii]MZK59291.1 ferritin-like domain-containing protein [Clostridium beijerinckii]MZK69410.1 ferritin-like domain-containing protein [Clostridium beijerinckii]MZK74783.1 ferritin-like domain-containing protein [Clostridium beijerinckii]MZK84501.1 ferritin-like domain-containing protein [Clostridium beijerinckii]